MGAVLNPVIIEPEDGYYTTSTLVETILQTEQPVLIQEQNWVIWPKDGYYTAVHLTLYIQGWELFILTFGLSELYFNLILLDLFFSKIFSILSQLWLIYIGLYPKIIHFFLNIQIDKYKKIGIEFVPVPSSGVRSSRIYRIN